MSCARQRAAIGLRRDLADDFIRARRSLRLRRRPAGEDALAARRLRDAGHLERPAHRELAEVRQRRDAEARSDLRVGQAVIDRRQQVVGHRVEALHERRRQAMRAGLHVNPRRDDVHAVRIGFAHARVDLEHRGALAVDRHFEQLALDRAAKQLAGRNRVQLHAEAVFAVGRERVLDRDAAARAERRALDVVHLRAGARNLVGELRGARFRIADRQRADAARRAQVAFHQRRRERLRVGDVVEAVADRVGRQERVDVDVDRKQRAHRARVFGAIEALERTAAGIGIERRGLIEPRFHRRRKRREHGRFGTTRVRRRHHARAQLADHFLRDFGDCCVVADLRRVKTCQRQSAGVVLVAIVVAGRAGTCLTSAVCRFARRLMSRASARQARD